MKKLILITTLLLCYFMLVCCESKNHETNAGAATGQRAEASGPDDHENPATASLTAAQIRSVGVETGPIEEKELTAALKATGILKVPNQNRAMVNTLYSGVVQSLRIQPGEFVKRGQVIATVTNPDFLRPQEEYVSVNARVALAELESDRQKELSAGNAGALKNFQAAATELKTLQSRRNALARQISLMGIDPEHLRSGDLISTLAVKSPISGVVSSVTVQIGSFVDLSSPIAEIVDNSQLHLDLFIYEKDLPKLRNNQVIHFTLTNAPDKEYDAQIFSLGSSFEGESKAVTVHAKVLGIKTGLIDGMNITAAVSLEKASVPAVPTDAVVNYQGQDYIFIVKDTLEAGDAPMADKTIFSKIAVAKGTTDVGYTEITLLQPVPAGAQVVIRGAFFVLAAMTNSGGAHDH